MSQKKFVYITILNWNGADDTIECLNSLEEDHYPNRKTLVIDNASTDDSVEKIRRAFPGVEIIKNEKLNNDWQFLPIDTKHFKDLEIEIIGKI